MSPLSSEEIAGLGFERVIASTPVSIVVVDTSGQVIYSNERARDLTAVLGREMPADLDQAVDIFHADGRRYERHEWPVLRSITSGEEIVEEEFFYAAPDGGRLWVRCSSSPVRDVDGEIVAAVVAQTDVSERKREEARLAVLAGLLDSTEDAIIAFDGDWRVTAWNKVGTSMWEALPDLVGTTIEPELRRAVREQRPVTFDTYSPRTHEWQEVRAYPSKEGGLLVFGHDITVRRAAEEQLHYHASLLENVEDGVIATDAEDFRVTAWNTGAERLYGFSAEEVLGQPARQTASFPGDEARLKLERELLETGRTRIEFTARRKDGSWVEVELIAVAVKDEHDQTGGYLGIHRDISDRKRAERELNEAHRQTEAILQTMGDAFSVLDSEWRYVYVNQRGLERIEELEGEAITLEEIVGKNIWERFPQLVGATADREFHRAVDEQRPVWFETVSPGAREWAEVRAFPSEDGGLAIYSRDISDRKRAEEQLERRAVQQAAVAELGLRAFEHVGSRSLMDEAVAVVCRTLGVEYAKVDELLPGGDGLLVRAGAGWRDGVVGNCVLPTGRGSPAGYALLAGEPLIVEDMTADTPFEVPSVLRDHGVMSDITVVIDAGGGQPIGTLVAASTQRRTFSEDDVSFVQSVANVLATAIERAQSEERLQSAQEAERSRIARALHDEALSSLADALTLAVAARGASPESAPSGQLVAVLRRVGQQLRGAIYDLRLETELQAPFPGLLEQLVTVHRALGVDCEIELEMRSGTPAGSLGATGIELVRIVGEALTNVRRHADARHARVRVWGADNKLWAEVSDDGRGFDPTAPRSPRHHGLAGMRERAQQVGGRLEIDSAPGVGTTVRLEAILPNGSSGAS
jgi:PAS domain S-box-containing protein